MNIKYSNLIDQSIKNNSSENSSEFITNEENPKEYFDSRNVRNLQESYTTTKAE
jgi:hypothetical protein